MSTFTIAKIFFQITGKIVLKVKFYCIKIDINQANKYNLKKAQN